MGPQSVLPLPLLVPKTKANRTCLVLYTGGNAVAKIVSAAAAKHLTPVSLELGGKSPVIIDSSCDLTMTAKRLLWGKTVNAGQTCVAPDYVLVPKSFQDTLVDALKKTYAPHHTSPILSKECTDSGLCRHDQFYPEGPASSDSFSRIISSRHFDRIKNLLDNSKGTIVVGGGTDADKKYIAPTILKDVKFDDSLMSE